MYMYIHVHQQCTMYMHVHVYMWGQTNQRSLDSMYMHVHVRVYLYTCIYIMHMHVHVYIHVITCVLCVCIAQLVVAVYELINIVALHPSSLSDEGAQFDPVNPQTLTSPQHSHSTMPSRVSMPNVEGLPASPSTANG